MTVRIDGRRLFTPMAAVILALGMTDLMFALDSIPAIFGLTKEPFLVFTANAFALLGLSELYFLLGALLQRLVYLSKGLAIILGFIGLKLISEALASNSLPFINGGEPVPWAPHISPALSLAVVVSILAVTVVASLIASKRGKAPPAGGPLGAAQDSDATRGTVRCPRVRSARRGADRPEAQLRRIRATGSLRLVLPVLPDHPQLLEVAGRVVDPGVQQRLLEVEPELQVAHGLLGQVAGSAEPEEDLPFRVHELVPPPRDEPQVIRPGVPSPSS